MTDLLRRQYDELAADNGRLLSRVVALQAENARLRAALVHRCVVREIQEQCEDCRDLVAVLDPTAGPRG